MFSALRGIRLLSSIQPLVFFVRQLVPNKIHLVQELVDVFKRRVSSFKLFQLFC